MAGPRLRRRRFGEQLSDLSDEKLAHARALFESGRTIAQVAVFLGASENFVTTFLGSAKEPLSSAELAAYRAAKPEDTRSFNARQAGDPPPGRSALEKRDIEISEADRKRARRVGVSPWLYRRLAVGPPFSSTSGGAVRSQKFNLG